MMRTGALEPRLAGPVDAGRLIVDLAPDLAREDVGVDESRAGMTVRGRAPPGAVIDDQADQALPRQVRDRLIRGDGDGFAARCALLLAPGMRLHYVRRQTASQDQHRYRQDTSCFHVDLLLSSKWGPGDQ